MTEREQFEKWAKGSFPASAVSAWAAWKAGRAELLRLREGLKELAQKWETEFRQYQDPPVSSDPKELLSTVAVSVGGRSRADTFHECAFKLLQLLLIEGEKKT